MIRKSMITAIKTISYPHRIYFALSRKPELPSLQLCSSIHTSYESLKMMASDTILLSYIKDQHFLLQDLVSYSIALSESIKSNKIQPSDIEIIFLAFVFNLYQNQFSSLTIYNLCIDHLKHKNSEGIFNFKSQEVQKKYLESMYYLIHKDIPSIISRLEFIQNYDKFLSNMFHIQKVLKEPFKDSSLDQLQQFFAYIPSQSLLKRSKKQVQSFGYLPKLMTHLVSYQIHRMVRLRQQQKSVQECIQESVDRFRKMREYCVLWSNLSHQNFNLFSLFPDKFEQEADFIIFITVLKQFLIEGLSEKINKNDLNSYNESLIRSIKNFRSPRAIKAVQAYCQNLIMLNLYKPESFVDYFDPEGPVYIPIQKRLLKWY